VSGVILRLGFADFDEKDRCDASVIRNLYEGRDRIRINYEKNKPGEESTGLRDYIRGIILA
jgi:hypothetical protein